MGVDDLLADFLTEVNEGLPELDNAVVRLEQAPDDGPTLSLIFRHVHTIKGTCGFLGLPRLERVAHAAEDVLGRLRDRKLKASGPIISHILSALDCIKRIVDALAETGTEPEGNDLALITALELVAEGHLTTASTVGNADAEPEPPVPAVADAAAAANAAADGTAAGDRTLAAQTIRVGVETLENLMTLVGELVLTRNQMIQLSRTQVDDPFAACLQRLSRLTSELQDNVTRTRMQPIGHAWNKLPRLIRDLARELDKQIEIDMHGAETELDRQVLEQIRDPLTHVVRNAADHGLEGREDRLAAGKDPVGRITLKAWHEGGHVLIAISDDGRGLNAERIRAKAVAQKLATEQQVAAMTEAEIQRFVFMPGFSTAAAVTSVSGRGVGMDVVKTNIERINGTVELRSAAGFGTTLTIRIPLTLAIVPALIVGAGGERFAVAQSSVIELVRVHDAAEQAASAARISRVGPTEMLRLRDSLLPLVELAALLELPSAGGGERVAVVVRGGGGTFGIVVDAVFDTEEIVVKPVAPVLRHLAMFSGNTILGDGSVTMILDPNGIAGATGFKGGSEGVDGTAGEEHRAARTPMLLFRGDGEIKAVALGAVARMEMVASEAVERTGGTTVMQYRGELMPVVAIGEPVPQRQQPLIVFEDAGVRIGAMVDEIVDVVDAELSIELSSERPGVLGMAVIAGRATEIIDHAWWLTRARSTVLAGPEAEPAGREDGAPHPPGRRTGASMRRLERAL